MFTLRQRIILVFIITLALVGGVRGEPEYSDTPADSVTAMPYGGTIVTEEMQTPESPLFAEASSVHGSNTGWAQAVPSGTYLVMLATQQRVESRKIMLVR